MAVSGVNGSDNWLLNLQNKYQKGNVAFPEQRPEGSPQVNYTSGEFGAVTTAPHVTGVQPAGNEYGISIPQNYAYTTDENGNKISLGQDGVGLAHRNKGDYNLMLIA